MFAIRHISANFYHQAMVQQVNYRVYHQSGTNNMFYESLSWLEEEFIYQVILSITLITKLTLRETHLICWTRIQREIWQNDIERYFKSRIFHDFTKFSQK